MTKAPPLFPLVTSDSIPLLKGEYVYLDVVNPSLREQLRPLAKDERLWEFTKTLLINDSFDEQFDRYFDEALNLADLGGQSFVIRRTADGAILGMTRFLNVDRKEKRLEIGHTWYIPQVWGKVHNKECKLLLLSYVLETLRYNRVEFRVAHQNVRSQKAVAKIGGIREGVLRFHAVRNDGSRRDTVVFSIIIDEWPETKKKLKALVDAGAAL